MITLCQIYSDFKGANNVWQQGHFRPLSFEYAVYEAILEIFNAGKKEWEQNQVISDELRPFFKSTLVPIKQVAAGGMIAYPPDYSQFSTLRYFNKSRTRGSKGLKIGDCDDTMDPKTGKCTPLREEEKAELAQQDLYEFDIPKIDNSRWGAACEHEFIPLDLENPGCTQYSAGFKVLPKSLGWVVLDYLAIPERPKIVFTVDSEDQFICDPEKCTNLAWNPEILPELMSRIKTKYASFIGSQQKYAEGVKELKESGT